MKYWRVLWNLSEFIIDVSIIMTQPEGEKERLEKSVSGLNTEKVSQSRLGWVAQNFPKIWYSWDRELTEHRIDPQSRWGCSLPQIQSSDPLHLPWKNRVSLLLICRSPLKGIIELFIWLIIIQTHDRDFNFHKHKIMMWLLWQWIAPGAAVWISYAQDENETQCNPPASRLTAPGSPHKEMSLCRDLGDFQMHV